jgi:hypothetical protein
MRHGAAVAKGRHPQGGGGGDSGPEGVDSGPRRVDSGPERVDSRTEEEGAGGAVGADSA